MHAFSRGVKAQGSCQLCGGRHHVGCTATVACGCACVQALREKQDEISAAKRELKQLEDSLVRR